MNGVTRMMCLLLVFLYLGTVVCVGGGTASIQPVTESEKLKDKREAAKAEKTKAKADQLVEQLAMPVDTTARFTVKKLSINGNALLSTEELLKDLPLVYNASDKPLKQADSDSLYDFRVLADIISNPGPPREISARTIQGFTQYLSSVYQSYDYAGVYVYVPADAIAAGAGAELEALPIEIIEGRVSTVGVTHYDANGTAVEKGYLRDSFITDWSPVQTGEPASRKKLDDFVNLLNLNPDRYLSATVSRGAEPNTFDVMYDIYEVNPWHWFIHVDNSGTKDRRWSPRIGLINTNLLGIDDKFIAMFQAPADSTALDEYSLFGSYDFPVWGPRLRLNLYGGYSEFDINPESGPFNFLGSGKFYGGILRYNLFQSDGWFFDLTGGLSHEESKVTPSLFPEFLATDIKMDLWSAGAEVYRSDDMGNTAFAFKRTECWGGSARDEFALSRTGVSPEFIIYNASASSGQYLDPNKVQRLSGTFQWIGSNERIPPAKMTAFGGMYTVRGYDEYEIVADGGILASVQYEFDLVKYDESKNGSQANQPGAEKPWIRKVAPLCFMDYGQAKIKDASATEKTREELMSIGIGTILELGDNFTGGVYYGYPLRATSDTREGKGRVSVFFLLKW